MKLIGLFEIVSIKKKTQAQLFKNLKVGDRITITKELGCESKRYSITKASYCEISIQTGESIIKSFTQLQPILKCFEMKQL